MVQWTGLSELRNFNFENDLLNYFKHSTACDRQAPRARSEFRPICGSETFIDIETFEEY